MNAHARRPARLISMLVVAPLIVGAPAGCGARDDADPGAGPAAPARTAAAANTPGAPARACTLVRTDAIQAGTGIGVGDGTPGGDGTRSTCTFPPSGAGPGLTVGVEAADRFADKTGSTQRSSGAPATEVAGVGDAARFYFSTAQLPAGLGTLVARDDRITVDVTVQGLTDPSRSRETASTIARTALRNG